MPYLLNCCAPKSAAVNKTVAIKRLGVCFVRLLCIKFVGGKEHGTSGGRKMHPGS